MLPILFCTISTSYYYSPDQVTRVDVRDNSVPEKKFSICQRDICVPEKFALKEPVLQSGLRCKFTKNLVVETIEN